jgi:hypothetical protein
VIAQYTNTFANMHVKLFVFSALYDTGGAVYAEASDAKKARRCRGGSARIHRLWSAQYGIGDTEQARTAIRKRYTDRTNAIPQILYIILSPRINRGRSFHPMALITPMLHPKTIPIPSLSQPQDLFPSIPWLSLHHGSTRIRSPPHDLSQPKTIHLWLLTKLCDNGTYLLYTVDKTLRHLR